MTLKGVRWSRAQYEAYCVKRGWTPSKPRKKSVPGSAASRKGKNKTEAEFEQWFKFEHPSLTLHFEAVRLRIDATCWYLPDFWCPELMTFFEIKGGYVWGDAIVKYKAARAIHTWAKFAAWQKKNGAWREILRLPEGDEE